MTDERADLDDRIAELRAILAGPLPPDVEPEWLRLALAELLTARGESAVDVGDLGEAIDGVRAVLADPDVTLDELAMSVAFQILGTAHALRARCAPDGMDDDLAEAAAAFRRSIDLMPASHPDPGGVTARYGVVLGMIVQNRVGGLDLFGDEPAREVKEFAEQVTTAVQTLDAGWRDLLPDDSYRTFVMLWRALTHATRFVYFGGDSADRDEAMAGLRAVLDVPESEGAIADLCHGYLALLHLFGAVPPGLRSRKPSLRSLARIFVGENLADADAARVARDHLDRMTGSTPAAVAMAAGLRAVVVIAVDGGNATDESLTEAMANFSEAADADPDDDDLGRLRSLMEIVRTARRSGFDEVERIADTLSGIAEEYGDENPFGQVMRAMLGQLLDLRPDAPPGGRSATPEERDAALEVLEHVLTQLPDDHPDRAMILNRLALVLTRSVEHGHSSERLDPVRDILLEAVERPAADDVNEALNHFLLAVVDRLRSLTGQHVQSPDDAVERLTRVAALLPKEHPVQRTIPVFLASVLLGWHMRGGALEHVDAADHYARLMTEGAPPDGGTREDVRTLMEWVRVVAPMARGQGMLDADTLDETIRAHRSLAERVPEEHSFRFMIESSGRTLEAARRQLDALGPNPRISLDDLDGVEDSEVAAARALGRNNPIFPTELGVLGFRMANRGFFRRDLALLDKGVALLAEAHEATDPLSPIRPWLLGVFGWTFLLRYQVGHDRADLNNAIDRLEEAARTGETGSLGGMSALSLGVLASAYHLRGDESLHDRRRAGETGLAALRARAWTVMLQSSTERAFTAALAAAGEGAAVARQCAATGFTDLAVEALEWGRAMVLHAATTDAALPALLREGGHDDLAAEWERTTVESVPAPWDEPGGPAEFESALAELRVPSDLRERVMDAIEGSAVERRLFNPAVPAEIAGALREADAAALVYLVPHEDGRGGLALIVDDTGQVRPLRLPRLATGPRSRVEAFVEAQRDRAAPGTGEANRIHRRWRYALGDLCDWAWTAVMEPVLDAVASVPGNRTRVVLVPVGELGAVPWHAARRTVGDGARRHACQDAVISYAASARQFVEAGRHGHRPWPSAAALVRVGGSGLYWAHKEIEQLHRRHYPDGDLLGGRRRPGRPRPPNATADNVRRLLPGPRSGGASLLHLGCHAHPAPRPVDSHLGLANGEALGMTDILRRARERPSGEPGGLVVLAACGSDLTSRDHDEALTLSTAFLAAGAVGVVGARWPVDDLPTTLFMTMFHHYLNAGYDDPAVALRAAQLWMLDPGRRVPPDLSGELADLLDTTPLDEPESWAAFTYQGR
ncbi:CHAT domain-containing protein [Actinomadura meridiana]|uniref:CHAT domain-containing protein n=1 Tax=Actinomadura meridiana TaxID=559626 RepID=A0ABP8CIX4_9ACTN